MKIRVDYRKISLFVIILLMLPIQSIPLIPMQQSDTQATIEAQDRWVPQMSPEVLISDACTSEEHPDVAFNSTYDEYLVVWLCDKKIVGRRVTSRGETLGSTFEIAAAATFTPGQPKVAYDVRHNRYLVIWSNNTGVTNYAMKGRFIPSDGPNPTLVSFDIDNTRLTNTNRYALAYAYNPDEYMVVWTHIPSGESLTKVVGRRIKADGTGFAAGSFVIAADSTYHRQHPDIAYNAARNEYVVTYDDYPKVNDNIWGTRLTAAGVALGSGEFVIAGWPDEEANPSIAACSAADQYLVTWHSIQSNGHDGIFARYVSGDGTPGTVNQLFADTYFENYRPSDAACGILNHPIYDPEYLVTWSENPNILGPVSGRGVTTSNLMSDAFDISYTTKWSSIAGGQINFLVAVESSGSIYARIVGNTKPRAAFHVTPSDDVSTTSFEFDANDSTDNTDDLSQLQVRWDWENDGIYDTTWSTEHIAYHQYILEPWQGIVQYLTKMIVTDGHGVTDTTSNIVTVRNTPPTALYSVAPVCGGLSTNFLFNASSSSDPEGGDLQARWDWDDNGSFDTGWSATLTANHTYGAAGIYIVRLQIKDSYEQVTERTHRVTVTASGMCPTYLPMITR